jgi:hypothetical protein
MVKADEVDEMVRFAVVMAAPKADVPVGDSTVFVPEPASSRTVNVGMYA